MGSVLALAGRRAKLLHTLRTRHVVSEPALPARGTVLGQVGRRADADKGVALVKVFGQLGKALSNVVSEILIDQQLVDAIQAQPALHWRQHAAKSCTG